MAELRRLLRSSAKQMAGNDEPEGARVGENLLDVAETVLRRPGAVFLSGAQPAGGAPDVRGAALVNLGEDLKRVQGLLETILGRLWTDRAQPVQLGGQSWHPISLGEGLPAILWGAHKTYLIAAVGEEELESLLKRMDEKPPAWLTVARRECAVPRPASMVYVDVKGILDLAWPFIRDPQAKAALEAVGVRSMTHLAAMTGLDQTGVVTRTVLGLEGQNLGIFRLADVQPLSPSDLSAVPRDATIAAAFRLDPERAWETLLGLLEKIDPRAGEEFARDVRGLEAEVGFNVRDDVLKSLGSAWCVYTSPSEGGAIPWGLTVVVRVKDAHRLAKAHDRLIARLREQFTSEDRSSDGSPQFSQFRFAGRDVHYLRIGGFGPPFGLPTTPSWCLTENELILALSPQGVTHPAKRMRLRDSVGGNDQAQRQLHSCIRNGS